MTNQVSAARASIGNLLLCAVVLSGLAACGTETAATQARAAIGDPTLVPPRAGMIDRGPGSTPTQPPTTTPPTTAIPPSTPPGHPPIKVTNGSATLDWTPPTLNNDGTALTNLAGYTVYYGTSPDQLTQSVKLSNPGLTVYTVSNLSSGTWYFTITSYSATGSESARSGVVSTTI